jgi:HAD superfamily hydrolase (TIGR01509 family)
MTEGRMQAVRTAIFDFDGTIADTLPLIYEAFDAALRPVLGRRLSDREVRDLFGPPDNYIIRAVAKDHDADAAFQRYVELYEREHERLVSVFPGLAEVLHTAKRKGMRIGVVTGKSRQTAIYSLEALGLLPDIDCIYAGDDVTHQKPDPEAVIKILADLGHQPGELGVFVGDSAADVHAGRAAGLRTIGVTWGNPDLQHMLDADPDATVDDAAGLARELGIER